MANSNIIDQSKELSRRLIDKYFRTVLYPYTKHHIDSYDNFVKQDLIGIIKSNNPVIIVKDLIDDVRNLYRYKVELYIGGENGDLIEIGTPTLSLQNTDDVRVLFPNEARLRNLTYASTIYADIHIKITYTEDKDTVQDLSPEPFLRWPLCNMPIMLHSSYCILHNKPKEFLKQAGECPYDNGGYFIVDGAEKILITRQEQAFNTLYITQQSQSDPKVNIFASIQCLSAESRQVKRVAFALMKYSKNMQKNIITHETIHVSLPFVRKPVPLFILFRALGFQSDLEIIQLIFPDFNNPEAQLLMDKLQPSIIDAFPFLTTHSAIQYIKTLTKGFSVAHVLDILRNQLFIHMPNDLLTKAIFLGECVRKILRVSEGYDNKTDRDDTRNQRCLTSGFLIQELFNNSYKLWIKSMRLAIDKEYNYNKEILYSGTNFVNIFSVSNQSKIFLAGMLNDMIMKGFKGKWGTGLGEEKTGALQSLSRLSYTDFMSHCRRIILDFDTSMKLTGPRKLHTTQYGYYCTSETPTGGSIGIAKNLSIMTAISTSTKSDKFLEWLDKKGKVFRADNITLEERVAFVPVYVNGGLLGYTDSPYELSGVIKLFKRTGCLPYSVSVVFSIRERNIQIYMDAGRPLRPLIWLEPGKTDVKDKYAKQYEKLRKYPTWRDLVLGNIKDLAHVNLDSTVFYDPYESSENVSLVQYIDKLADVAGAIEYVDPYEQNETYIANFAYDLRPETTHIEIHPSTIMSMMTSMIPFAPHNQSPRNQLSCSQSKQGVSVYATNWRNRFDNSAHVLCYGEMPLVRTIYNNYLGEGNMVYGMNCILAIACWSGYNQEDGIVMNYDAVQRGMFRTISYRSYEAFEEDDQKANTRVRFANPMNVANWKDLRPGLDYSKLDENGFIRQGEFVDENTVIVGGYMLNTLNSQIKDASLTPQVWTRGRVEKIAVMVNNKGMRLVKIRVSQDRIPELGDKFCLSPDHDVLTKRGWQPITEITLKDKVAQRAADGALEWVHPEQLIKLEHTGTMYEVHCESGVKPLCVSPEHKIFGMYKKDDIYKAFLEEVQNLNINQPTYQINHNYKLDCITKLELHTTNPSGYIYCLTVPSHVFMVRRQGAEFGYWTGNSNRHGQKGTIGALLRGHDMPRTQSGIIPDMIMNPHAIPSRMTIAQNLEQLLGKAGLQCGAFGDGTSFMNSESPQEDIGTILEGNGFEKYGNEVMYNGATGEQINASIFIGPVYGMRLKHMVEDKWQARAKGRKESRTHQPTAGRGSQGGLKIGEMDRDAINGHAISSFLKESYMERSDGAKIPICISCGTVPIYNPRLNITLCSLCDGPLQYIGDTVNNLELLPPLGRPKSRIVEVEIPYATKLLAQEQEGFLNVSMRFITTNGVECLRPLDRKLYPITEVEDVQLEPTVFQSIAAPAFIESNPLDNFSTEQITSLIESVKELKEMKENPEQDILAPDVVEEFEISNPVMDTFGQADAFSAPAFGQADAFGQALPNEVININIMQPQQPQPQQPQPQQALQQGSQALPNVAAMPSLFSDQPVNLPEEQQVQLPMQQPMQPQQQVQMQPQQQQQQQPQQMQQQQPQQQPQQGGSQDRLINIPSTPSAAPIIAVDTSMDAMERDGINYMGGGRPVRRRFQQNNFQQGGMQPPQQGNNSNSVGLLTITKLE